MSQRELATAAAVSLSTVNDFEREAHMPYPDNLAAIRATLEAAGIVFIEGDDTIGVVLRLSDPEGN